MRVSILVFCGSTIACGIAFTAGTATPPPPAKFEDERPRMEEERKLTNTTPEGAPTVGVSVVVGGAPIDAGPLPKPPVPIVKPAP